MTDSDGASRTFAALQKLEPGRLQQLGDEVLRTYRAELGTLRASGLTTEGKSRKGVPDSLVGADPATCTIAVEYTSQATTLDAKFAADYAKVRQKCPLARAVYLCTNRSLDGVDLSVLTQTAFTDGVRLSYVDGRALARMLDDDRADLRDKYLGIPIGAHTRVSLIHAARERLLRGLPARLQSIGAQRPIQRPHAERRLCALLARTEAAPVVLIADAGMGKSTLSARLALSRAYAQPVAWMQANAGLFSQADPISLAALHAAFGAADIARAPELADLLRREHLRLLILLDAIDESRDWSRLVEALRLFETSALGPRSQLLLTARREAMGGLRDFLNAWNPNLLDDRRGGAVSLEALESEDATAFLVGEGASESEAREILTSLPEELRGNPLFLSRARSLSKASDGSMGSVAGFIHAVAERGLDDVDARMNEDGKRPRRDRVASILTQAAGCMIGRSPETITRSGLGELLGAALDHDGENSLLGRIVQAGILEETTEGDYAFSHALFLEEFAARATSASEPWPARFPPLSTPTGLQVARRIARFAPEPVSLLRAILPNDPLTSCECVADIAMPLPEDLTAALVSAVSAPLASRFSSDVEHALRALGSMKTREAKTKAVEWFNGLSEPERRSWSIDGAALFLQLEVPGAADVVLSHRGFLTTGWYEPSFVKELERTSTGFRDVIRRRARARLADPALDERHRPVFIQALAMLRDGDAVCPHLSDRIARGVPLTEEDHRALVYLNSEASIALYAQSIDTEMWRPLAQYRGTEAEQKSARDYRFDCLALRTTDLRMFPRERLDEMIEAAFASSNVDHRWLAMRWAEFLQDPKFLPSYARAKRLRRGVYLDFGFKLVESLVQSSSFDGAKALYEEHADDADICAAIVSFIHHVPSPETEAFLIERITEGRFVRQAIQSLGFLRAVAGAPSILDAYETSSNAWLREVAVRALGMIRSEAALPSLIHDLRAQLALPHGVRRDVYYLIRAIAKIDVPGSVDVLCEAFAVEPHQYAALEGLLRMEAAGAVEAASSLVAEFGVTPDELANALPERDFDDGSVRIDAPILPTLRDQALLRVLLVGADAAVASQDLIRFLNMIHALARFDMPEAHAYLNAVAFAQTGEPSRYALDVLANRGHPRAQRAAIERELDLHSDPRRPFSSINVERIARWPRSMVREALLARIHRGEDEQVGRWLFALQWFASHEDQALFEKFESATSLGAAEVAHAFLRYGGPLRGGVA